jgi:hypothetical protein
LAIERGANLGQGLEAYALTRPVFSIDKLTSEMPISAASSRERILRRANITSRCTGIGMGASYEARFFLGKGSGLLEDRGKDNNDQSEDQPQGGSENGPRLQRSMQGIRPAGDVDRVGPRDAGVGLDLEGGYLNLSSNVTRDGMGRRDHLRRKARRPSSGASASSSIPPLPSKAAPALPSRSSMAKRWRRAPIPASAEACKSTPVSNAETNDMSVALVLGGGIEYELDRYWTARLDYQFMNFRDELALPPIDGSGWMQEDEVHALKAVLSYRF